MTLFTGRLVMVLAVFLSGVPVQALDFDKEINKQEKVVQVRYNKPPHSLAYFLRQYESCKSQFGRARSQCNLREAKRKYYEYSYAWQEKQRQKSAEVAVGEMHVNLEKRDGIRY